MIKITDLNGARLKKDLEASRCIKRYYNRHVDGSGNFGFTIVKDGVWFTLDGDYDSDGSICKLEIADYGYTGNPFRQLEATSYEELLTQASDYMKSHIAHLVAQKLQQAP